MITNLPKDVIEDIISRVPLKSMRAVRLTCREWNTLWKSRIFTMTHIGKASSPIKEGESQMIMVLDYDLYLTSVFINADVDPSTEHRGKLTCLKEQVKISKVFHCEGLLLCIFEDDGTKVVVWNPYLGETRWIELRYSLHGVLVWDMFSYALGYEDKNSRRSLKFLRFFYGSYFFGSRNEFEWYEIYDFNSGLWTTLDVTDPYWRIVSPDGVSLKGNTYWCATEINSNNYYYQHADHIICFDYTRESFGPLLPLPFEGIGTLSCVREEKLAVLYDDYYRDQDLFEIWITTTIDTEKVSWSKFLRVNDSIPFTTSFFIDEVKKVVMLFAVRYLKSRRKKERRNRRTLHIIGKARYVRQVDLGESSPDSRCLPYVCSYVPSLVQIEQPQGGQMKKQSNLEKDRYDQNMSRLSIFKSRYIAELERKRKN